MLSVLKYYTLFYLIISNNALMCKQYLNDVVGERFYIVAGVLSVHRSQLSNHMFCLFAK